MKHKQTLSKEKQKFLDKTAGIIKGVNMKQKPITNFEWALILILIAILVLLTYSNVRIGNLMEKCIEVQECQLYI